MKTEYLIMILGGNTMQLPAIRLAKAKGWQVILVDRNRNVPGRQMADYFEQIDLKDKEEILAAARQYNKITHLDGIFTAGTDFSTSVAYVAEQMQLPGIPYHVAVAATDKAVMRKIFTEKGVPSPGFVKIHRDENPISALDSLGLPLVIKPVDNMGARGVRKIEKPEQLEPAFQAAIKASRSATVIIEEFIDGREFSLDAIVYKGEITLCGVADRQICFSPYFVEMGHTMPAAIPAEEITQLIDVFKAGITALGITDGAAKGDIFLSPAGVKVGEIAARLSGGYMSGWTYPYASGIEPTAAALNISVGLPPGELKPIRKCVSAERAFISIPGIIREISGLDNVSAFPGIKDVFCLVKAGDEVKFPSNNVEKCGNIISLGNSRSEAITYAYRAIKAINIRLEPDTGATEKFLFYQTNADYPLINAYSTDILQNIPAFWSMPFFINLSDNPKTFSVIPLPGIESELKPDWNGNTLQETIRIIQQQSGRNIFHENIPGELRIGKIFWLAVFKGGYQGGVYCLDILTRLIKQGSDIIHRLRRWAE